MSPTKFSWYSTLWCSNLSVSQLYPGSTSDKEIVLKCGILEKKLWEENDSVMADRGFLIHEDVKKIGVTFNIPAFLNGREKFKSSHRDLLAKYLFEGGCTFLENVYVFEA